MKHATPFLGNVTDQIIARAQWIIKAGLFVTKLNVGKMEILVKTMVFLSLKAKCLAYENEIFCFCEQELYTGKYCDKKCPKECVYGHCSDINVY